MLYRSELKQNVLTTVPLYLDAFTNNTVITFIAVALHLPLFSLLQLHCTGWL